MQGYISTHVISVGDEGAYIPTESSLALFVVAYEILIHVFSCMSRMKVAAIE